MFNGARALAQRAWETNQATAAGLDKHMALCNEYHRNAEVQRAALTTSMESVRQDLTGAHVNLKKEVASIRSSFWRSQIATAAGGVGVLLTALGSVLYFLLEHIDKLAH